MANFVRSIPFPPCAFHSLTGYYCPGCGGTRSLIALLEGKVILSLFYHPLILYTAVFGGWFLLSNAIQFASRKRVKIGMPFRPIYFYIALFLALGHAFILDFFLFFQNVDIFAKL